MRLKISHKFAKKTVLFASIFYGGELGNTINFLLQTYLNSKILRKLAFKPNFFNLIQTNCGSESVNNGKKF